MRILIAYDGSGYSHASLSDLQRAGLPPNADVVVLSISEILLSPPGEQKDIASVADTDIAEYFQKYYDQSDRKFAEAKALAKAAKTELLRYFPRWTIETDAFAGSPASLILSTAVEFKPDLIVMGSQGLSSGSERGLGSTSQKVLAGATCSVRVARSSGNLDLFPLKIVIGFNNSRSSLQAIESLAQRSWGVVPEIRLITVTEFLNPLIPGRVLRPIPGWSEGKMKGEEKWVSAFAAGALQVLNEAGLPATLHVYSGNPRLVLIQEAQEWKADSIFLGANSCQTQSSPNDLGCVSSSVASRASCSVEVIR